MIVRETLPFHPEALALDTEEGRQSLGRIYAPPSSRWVRLNMITTLVGSAIGGDGTSNTITSRVDRTILSIIRAHADVVVVGAQTVRAEGYVLPRGGAVLAIVTSSGDIGTSLDDIDDADRGRVLLLTESASKEQVAARNPGFRTGVIAVDPSADGHLTPTGLLTALERRGLTRVVCEGGVSLASQFLEAGSIDEVCVTVAPVIGPVDRPFVQIDRSLPLAVAGILQDDAGFNYLRLRPER